MSTSDDRDVAIMANVVFHGLCELDEEPGWQNIGPLADEDIREGKGNSVAKTKRSNER